MTATHGIAVMFDVTASSREVAAKALVDHLAAAGIVTQFDGGDIESWWLVEAQDKHADRNDNLPGVVSFDVDLVLG